jgi:hypothetical protein
LTGGNFAVSTKTHRFRHHAAHFFSHWLPAAKVFAAEGHKQDACGNRETGNAQTRGSRTRGGAALGDIAGKFLHRRHDIF